MSATEIRHSIVPLNGIEMHVAEAATGPLVLLCHGWPELWYSWRHQLRALAEAGFRAVAPDMRGFGGTTAPPMIAAYTIFHNVGDMVALVSALGATRAVIVGHDWGAPVAWHAALMRPDVFTAVVGAERAAPPARPRAAARPAAQGRQVRLLLDLFPGAGAPRTSSSAMRAFTLGAVLYIGSGDTPRDDKMSLYVDRAERLSRAGARWRPLPPWLTEADIEVFATEYRAHRLSRRAQLVSQHRPQLGADRAMA